LVNVEPDTKPDGGATVCAERQLQRTEKAKFIFTQRFAPEKLFFQSARNLSH